MFSHPTMIERDLGAFAVDARFRAAIARRIEFRLNKLPGAPHSTLIPFIEQLVLRALQRSVPRGDGDAPLNFADFRALLADGENARGLSSVARTVLKGLTNDLAICAGVAQRSRVVGAFDAIVNEFRNAYRGESRRAYGTAS
jgi:hypothetical protein